MKLLLDEMYAASIAKQLRACGHDVVSVHDPDYRALDGAPDEEIWAAAVAAGRTLVSENVADFRRIGSPAAWRKRRVAAGRCARRRRGRVVGAILARSDGSYAHSMPSWTPIRCWRPLSSSSHPARGT